MIQINAAAPLPPTMVHGKTPFQHRSGRSRNHGYQRGYDCLCRVFHLGRTMKAGLR
jgi:hypothetical protein